MLKETGRELSAKNLYIAWIWNLWGAPPVNLGALCFTSLLRAALCRTFYINGKEPYKWELGTRKAQALSLEGRE